MLRALLVSALALTATTAHAAGGGGGEASKDKEGAQFVDLAPVALPIVSRGSLVNYVFVNVRIHLNAGVNVPKLRDKEPYFRDALVRAAHRTPFTDPKDFMAVDAAKLTAAMKREAVAIAGPAVKSVEVKAQTPKRRIVMPKA